MVRTGPFERLMRRQEHDNGKSDRYVQNIVAAADNAILHWQVTTPLFEEDVVSSDSMQRRLCSSRKNRPDQWKRFV